MTVNGALLTRGNQDTYFSSVLTQYFRPTVAGTYEFACVIGNYGVGNTLNGQFPYPGTQVVFK